MTFRTKPGIEKLSAYQLADLTAPVDVPVISLAQNELPFVPSTKVLESGARAAADANLYPDPSWSELTHAIALQHQINQKQILCGAGSMELLELMGRCYLSESDAIVMSEFGYSFMKTVAQMYDARIDVAGEIDYTVNVDRLLEKVRPQTRMVFVANPGNPTGTLLSARELTRLREELPGDILLIIDEAYAEFADTDDYPPLFHLADSGHTVILRTFSKIYGLAGMRVGWGYFPIEIYQTVRKVLNPNNISAVSQACATAAICDQTEMLRRNRQINTIKSGFRRDLQAMGYHIPESHSNFLLIDFGSEKIARSVDLKLKNRGVILRPMHAYGLPHCLRATISHRQHMDFVIEILNDVN